MANISPLGRIPVLFDGKAHLYESGAALLEELVQLNACC